MSGNNNDSKFLLFNLPSEPVVTERLCFHKCLSFCPQGGGVHPRPDTPLDRHPLRQKHSLCRHPPRQNPPKQTPPPQRRPLLRAVRILLECILVFVCTYTVNEVSCVKYVSQELLERFRFKDSRTNRYECPELCSQIVTVNFEFDLQQHTFNS